MEKKRFGFLSLPIELVAIFIVIILLVVLTFSSSATVRRTQADVEKIAQGDTVLFSMLESSLCAPNSGAPFKYAIGIWLTYGAPKNDIVSINYNGGTDFITISDCVRRFLQSVKVESYSFSAVYGSKHLTVVPFTGPAYDDSKPKKTEVIYISVPDSASGVAEITLNTNIPDTGADACPEKEGTYFCAPKTYCLIDKGTCNDNYFCGGARCCCSK